MPIAGEALVAAPGAKQADQQRGGGKPGQCVHRHRRRDCPKPAGKHKPAREHTHPSGRRGHQADPQEASQHGEPERHTNAISGP